MPQGGMDFLLIGIGGALGSIARVFVARAVGQSAGSGFPYGTLSVNVIGSFLMGLAFVYIFQRLGGHERAGFLVMSGVLGGFTTFSAFALDAFSLIEAGRYGATLTYIGLSVLASLVALVLGIVLARAVLL